MRKYEEHEWTFKGMHHREGARDGDIYDAVNISMGDYPSVSVRKARRLLPFEISGKVYGVGSADKLFWCSGDSSASTQNDSNEGVQFYYDGEAKFYVEASEKTFSVINKYVCIFPDKMYYSLWGDEAKNLQPDAITLYESLGLLNEAMEGSTEIKDGDVYAVGLTEPYSFFQFNSKGKWKGATTEDHAKQTRWIYLMDSWGKLDDKVTVPYDLEGTSMEGFNTEKIAVDDYGEIACLGLMTGANGQYAERFAKWIRPGDTVKVTKIRDNGEVLTDYVKFIKKVNSGTDTKSYTYFAFDPVVISTSASNYSKITIERAVPDLSFAFCHDNRLWGVEKDKIYASKLGDPFNFQDYSTIADASWAVGVASSGPFTGGIAYNGYPTFFKEDRIIRVSGDYPAQYSTFETADIPGVMKGSPKSLAVADGVLYYLSPEGVCAYTGSYPTVIGDDIGEVLTNGYGGAGGDKYYLEAEILRSAQNDSWGRVVYVYDTKVRAWTKEDALNTVGFTDIGRDIYALTEKGIYLLDSVKEEGEAEGDIDSVLEFAPIYDGHLKKKGVSRIHLSIGAETGAEVRLLISYDKEGYKEVMKISPSVRRNYNIPLTVRRCGFYQLKIMAKGGYALYGISRERYFGSEY